MNLQYLGHSEGWDRDLAGKADVIVFTNWGEIITAGYFAKPKFDDSVPYSIGCGCCSEPRLPDEGTTVHYWKVSP